MRIWTYTLAAPVTVPYDPAPDPNRVAQIVSGTHRGVPACGDFIWTSSQLVQGTAHILHFPPGAAPPTSFWLLHYCARAVVVGVHPGPFEWGRLGQQAQDAFGAECFGRGQFGIQFSTRTFVFGQQLQAPPHGAILHLVKLLPAPSANSNAWDTSPDPLPLRTFDYDICMGPHGEVPIVRGVGEAMRRSPADSQPIQRNPPPDRAPDLVSLTRQIESVATGLQALNTRLEDAGVFRATPPSQLGTSDAPSVEPVEPDQSPAVRPFVTRFLLICGFWSFHANRWAALASVLVLLPPCSGDGVSEESDDSPEGSPEPEPPSEPDLTDVSAPTPRNVVSRRGSVEAYVRPSDDDLARTSAPRIGTDNVAGPVFQATEIPAIQRRVLAMFNEVDVERPPVPFIPAGCPVVIHNPFTSRSQAQHLTGIVGTPQIFRDLMHDYSVRRGWQPLISVHPQPDDRALHLIPAAAEGSLVSVVFRNGDNLHPRCLARTMPAADYHSIRLDGRRGRLRLPYHIRRSADQPLHFRDGECLHADTGPWGPPPPTPAVPSAAMRRGATLFPALLLLLSCPRKQGFGILIGLLVVGTPAMLHSEAVTSVMSGMVSPSLYPWRQPASRALLSTVTAGNPVRCVLACPWTGPQGAFQGGSGLTVEAAHFRFADALLADTSLMPIWPGPHPYQLTFVPHLASPSMVCVLMHYEGTLRSIVILRRLDYSDLICTVRFHLGQDVNQVRLPPALHAKRIHAPDRPMHLRDGDLLDVLASRPSRREVVRQSCFLKDKILWTRDFDIGDDIAVRLWMPHIQGPLFTWLEPGSRWDACDLTFTGSFRDRFPGCWVPVQWCPGQSPHLVQVPAEPRVVSVLHDSSHGVAGMQVVPSLARSELAEILHTLPSQLFVLGYPHVSVDHIMSLRDGDVLWDSMNYEDTHSEWPYIADAVSEASFLFSLGLIGGRPGFLVAVLRLLHCAYGTREIGPPSRTRSRSHSANQRRGYPPSPRAGRWRPELSHPMTEVFSSRHCEYRILCPFRGWHSVNTALPSSSYDFLLSAVRFVTGPWADDFLVLGPDAYGEPLVFLPIQLGPLVTLLVTSGGLTKAILFPRRACFHDLQQYCQRLFTLTGLPLRGPPALRHYMTHPWVPVTLRSGDTFSLHIPDTFHAFRSVPHPTADHPNMLPQLNLWHVDFQLLEGGWVYVWNDAGPPDLHRQRVWIDACSIWTPTCRQFRRPGELPRNFAWVPVPCLGDGRCHFVRATDEGEATMRLEQTRRNAASLPTSIAVFFHLGGHCDLTLKIRNRMQVSVTGMC